MTVELVELRLHEPACAAGAAAVVAEFPEPVVLLALRAQISPWSSETRLALGTLEEPRRFGGAALERGGRLEIPPAQLAGEVTSLVASVAGDARESGHGSVILHALVAVPRIVEAS